MGNIPSTSSCALKRRPLLSNEILDAAKRTEMFRQIITKIDSGKIDLDPNHYRSSRQNSFNVMKAFEDEMRPLKAVATDFVVREFFASEDTLFMFLKTIQVWFQEALHEFRRMYNLNENQVLFVFKGGNILRFIAKEFLLELPNSAVRELTDHYAPFFERSDSDFAIYLSPDVDDYELRFKQIGYLAFTVLQKLNREFQKNIFDYFDYFRFSKNYQQRRLLDPLLEQMNNAAAAAALDTQYAAISLLNSIGQQQQQEQDSDNNNNCNGDDDDDDFLDSVLHDVFGDDDDRKTNNDNDNSNNNNNNNRPIYKPSPDLAIGFKTSVLQQHGGEQWWLHSESREAIFVPVKKNRFVFTTNYNDALDFARGNTRIRFALARTKIAFNLFPTAATAATAAAIAAANATATADAGSEKDMQVVKGELIDVSIAHRDDHRLLHFFENVDGNSSDYHIQFHNSKTKDTDVLEFKAYSLSFLVDDLEETIFENAGAPWEDKKYIKRINRLFFYFLIDLFVRHENAKTKLRVLEKSKRLIFDPISKLTSESTHYPQYRTFIEKYPDLQITKFVKRLEELQDVVIMSDDKEIMKKFNELGSACSENIQFLLETIRKVRQYCSDDGNINKEDLYHQSMADFA